MDKQTELQRPTDPLSLYSPLISGLLDLSWQRRNLLLLRPLFQLELNKQQIADEADPDKGLFLGVDTQYLVLSALDNMMEGTTISIDRTSEEVLGRAIRPRKGALGGLKRAGQ